MDAESVIKASKLFYGIDATTSAHEQPKPATTAKTVTA
jgi:hypothetical protein